MLISDSFGLCILYMFCIIKPWTENLVYFFRYLVYTEKIYMNDIYEFKTTKTFFFSSTFSEHMLAHKTKLRTQNSNVLFQDCSILSLILVNFVMKKNIDHLNFSI